MVKFSLEERFSDLLETPLYSNELAARYADKYGISERWAREQIIRLKNGIASGQIRKVRRLKMPHRKVLYGQTMDSIMEEIEDRRRAGFDKVWLEPHTCPKCHGRRQLINPRTKKALALVEAFSLTEYASCIGCKIVWPLGPRRELRTDHATLEEAYEVSHAREVARVLQRLHYWPWYRPQPAWMKRLREEFKAQPPALAYTTKGWLPGGPEPMVDLSEREEK